VLHPGAVVIVPYADKDHIVLLRQFRYAAAGDLWEIPAGTREGREPTLACAKRELEEETGFRARKWELLTRFLPAPGISNELMTMYKASALFPGKKDLDHDEWIEHEIVSVKKARRMIRDGRIRDGKTLIGILWASLG
jgi:ADP-ribose pyrophosphatase